jgi:colicin import membrane protein
MPRKLKTYQTSLGFFDQAIAAPSMKAALDAWGAESNLFHQGAARETDDPEAVATTMAKPGVVLRRPVGSSGPFTEHAALPTDLAGDVGGRSVRHRPKSNKPPAGKTDEKAARQAALEYERTERQRAIERRKEEAAKAKERQRREPPIAKAQAALDKAKREHDARAGAIEVEHGKTGRKRKMLAGRGRGRSWRPLCAGRGNSGGWRYGARLQERTISPARAPADRRARNEKIWSPSNSRLRNKPPSRALVGGTEHRIKMTPCLGVSSFCWSRSPARSASRKP